jgi:hypothetical protein
VKPFKRKQYTEDNPGEPVSSSTHGFTGSEPRAAGRGKGL